MPLTEWLYEAGIGEARAALIDDGRIVKARIELDDGAPRVGAVLAARLIDVRERRVALDGGGEALLDAVPGGLTQGAALRVTITRTATGSQYGGTEYIVTAYQDPTHYHLWMGWVSN